MPNDKLIACQECGKPLNESSRQWEFANDIRSWVHRHKDDRVFDSHKIDRSAKWVEGLPIIVCLCGSTRFKQAFIEANFRETMAGKIVLSVGWFGHADGHVYTPTEAEKIALDELHKRKIDLCDEVLAINIDGYVGDSTRSEIDYALSLGKPVRYLQEAIE